MEPDWDGMALALADLMLPQLRCVAKAEGLHIFGRHRDALAREIVASRRAAWLAGREPVCEENSLWGLYGWKAV